MYSSRYHYFWFTQESAKLSLPPHIFIHVKRSDCQQAEALDLISIIGCYNATVGTNHYSTDGQYWDFIQLQIDEIKVWICLEMD